MENNNQKKKWYRKWWVWVIAVFVVLIAINGGEDNSSNIEDTTENVVVEEKEDKKEVVVADFSGMSQTDAEAWGIENNVSIKFNEEYSDTVETGAMVSQSVTANEMVKEGGSITIVLSKGKKPSIEYQNALKKAETYSDMMHMSKQRIYDQLTSEYGEQFPADAAQYAVDNLKADYNKNALEKAKSYQETMSMSKQRIYDQLISEYGEQFTAEQAQYAINHLDD